MTDSLQQKIAEKISFAIQGVQEYTAPPSKLAAERNKTMQAYYDNRAKWVETEAEAILNLVLDEIKKQLPEIIEDDPLGNDRFLEGLNEALRIVLNILTKIGEQK